MRVWRIMRIRGACINVDPSLTPASNYKMITGKFINYMTGNSNNNEKYDRIE